MSITPEYPADRDGSPVAAATIRSPLFGKAPHSRARRRFLGRAHHSVRAATCLSLALSALQGFSAEPLGSLQPVVSTNYVLVTNIVVVTNYIVTTNIISSTNASTAGPDTPTLQRSHAATPALPDLAWVPPEDGFDWIQLKSGEWLKGSIKAMQERKLEFDSDELKLLSFDWKDIRQLRSPRQNEMLLVNHEKLTGPVAITPEQVTVGGAEPRAFARNQLQSITRGGSKERNYWSGKVSMGLTLHSGNTKSVDYNAQASLQRRTPATRFKLDYIGNVSSADDVESANNHRVNTEFDYWLSRRLYIILPSAEYFRDPFQNIDNRATAGGGVGFDLIDRSALEWNVSAGPAYQKTWFDSVPVGEPTSRDAVAFTFGTRFDWEITRRIDLSFEYRGQYTSRAVGETFHHTVTTLSLELTKRFDLDVSFVWDRTQDPIQQLGGAVPKQDDFRLILGLGVRF
jgi:putative salt-induced outer membrane protein YdiY